jgi:phosphorylcholine metabolism protein LicD
MYYFFKILISIIIIIILIIYNNKLYLHFSNEIEFSPKLSIQDISDLKKGQKIMTNMLKKFDRICRKYNLKYWCLGGTLIGAMRHNGWIPWDGDIDVGMLKEDYNKLQQIIQPELPKEMWFQTHENDKYWPNKNISKIRYLNATYKRKKNDPRDKWHNGLQLDIFIFNENKEYIHGHKKFKKNNIFPLKEALFENIKVYIPNNYDLVLKIEGYNNYMTLLPINKRIPHEGLIYLNVPDWIKQKYPKLY